MKEYTINPEEYLPSDVSDGEYAVKSDLYPSPYSVRNGSLYMKKATRSGETFVQLCNFVPKILEILTVDNGEEQTRQYVIGGTDEDGKALPPVAVPATPLWCSSSPTTRT